MKEFEQLIGIRDTLVDGIGPWYWLRADTGAWEGPKTDWEQNHKFKWFEHVKNYDVCFQAGSCLGMYPRLLSERFQRVYTCEPDVLNHYVAGLNCQKETIHRFNAAVGQHNGTFTGVFRQSTDNVGMHRTGGEGSVPIISIDSLNLPVCGLIALDIEGYEINALRGAVQTIQRCSPVVVAEMPSEEVRTLMTELGYEMSAQSVSDVVFVKT